MTDDRLGRGDEQVQDLNWYATGGRCPKCGAPKRYREWWDDNWPDGGRGRTQYSCANELCDWWENP